MVLRPLSFQKSAVLACAAAACFGQDARFTPTDALRAEWARTPPALTLTEVAAEDRARLDLTLTDPVQQEVEVELVVRGSTARPARA